jgi:hypothetical protein
MCLLSTPLSAQIRLSEILYNEPGSRTRLEWIELYNPTDNSTPLSDYRLIINSDTLNFSAGEISNSGDYMVISRQLLSNNGSDSFEGRWGDSSGFWGDYYLEDYNAYSLDFSLPNSEGQILILNSRSAIIDSFSWNSAGLDGISFERDNFDANSHSWHQCRYSDGSTPGHNNSSPDEIGDYDLNIEPRLISLSRGETMSIAFSVPIGSAWSLEIFSDTGRRVKAVCSADEGSWSSFTWNGSDDNGNQLPPGIYIVLAGFDSSYKKAKSIPVVIAP